MTLATPFPIQVASKLFGEDVMYRLLDDLFGAGVTAATDLQVIQNPAGANLSVTVAPGEAYVALANGGKRQVYNDANSNSGAVTPNPVDWLATFAAADGVNPRIDRVVLTVRDSTIDGTGSYDAKFKVVQGVATSGATLVNLTGAAAVPANSILLANVLVSAGATTIVTANIDTTVRVRARLGSGAATVTSLAGLEVDYAQVTTPQSAVTALTEGTAVAQITGNSVVYDGTRVKIEFFAPGLLTGGGTTYAFIVLYRDSTVIGRAGVNLPGSPVSPGVSMYFPTFDTPGAGSHTYSAKMFISNATGNSVALQAGNGGAGNPPPAFLRVTRA